MLGWLDIWPSSLTERKARYDHWSWQWLFRAKPWADHLGLGVPIRWLHCCGPFDRGGPGRLHWHSRHANSKLGVSLPPGCADRNPSRIDAVVYQPEVGG